MDKQNEAAPTRRGGRGERRALRTKPNHEMLPQLTGKLPLTVLSKQTAQDGYHRRCYALNGLLKTKYQRQDI